jgi:hypothetical protein
MKINPNDKVWVFHNNELAEVICKFVSPTEIAYEYKGNLFSCAKTNVYKTKESAENKRASVTMVVFCREVSKNDGMCSVYEVKSNPDNHDILCMSLRGRYNPELKYAVAMKNWFDEHSTQLKNESFFFSAEKQGKLVIL